MIAEAVARAPAGKYEKDMTMAEWMVRRIRAKRNAGYNVRAQSMVGMGVGRLTVAYRTQRVGSSGVEPRTRLFRALSTLEGRRPTNDCL